MLRIGALCVAVTFGLFMATAMAGDYLNHRIAVAVDEMPGTINIFGAITSPHVERLVAMRDAARKAIPILGPATAASLVVLSAGAVYEIALRLRRYLESRKAE